MGREAKGYTAGSSGGRVPASFVLVAMAVDVVAAVVAAVAAASVAGPAQAATPTRATIEATQFTVPSNGIGEAFARCPVNKRALGGGVVQSGPPNSLLVNASGPLDSTGVTLQTNDGDVAKQWYAAVSNNSTAQLQRTFRAFAICE